MVKRKQPFLKTGSDGEFVFSRKRSPVLARVDASCKPHTTLAWQGNYSILCILMQNPLWKYFLFPYRKNSIVFHGAWTMPYQIICAHAAYVGLDADMWYSAVRKAGVTTAATAASAGLLNLEVGLINLCFIKGSCRVKSVQLGWYPPQTINDADTFGPSPLRNSKSDLKVSDGSDSADFQLRGSLNASTSIHINSCPDTWAHSLELLMHMLEVCSPPSLPSHFTLLSVIYLLFLFFLCSVFAHPLVNYPDFSLFLSPGLRHYLPFSSRNIPLVFIRHPFPTSPKVQFAVFLP